MCWTFHLSFLNLSRFLWPIPPAHWPLPTSWWHLWILWGCMHPIFQVDKAIKISVISTTLKNTTCNLWLVRLWMIEQYSLNPTVQPVCHSPCCPPINSTSPNAEDKEAMDIMSKALIHSSPYSRRYVSIHSTLAILDKSSLPPTCWIRAIVEQRLQVSLQH